MKSSAVVTADAAGCVCGAVSVLLTDLRAASELSACATSGMTSAFWLDSKQLPAALPELSL